jgi:protein-L-isoaspartate(D-aspartate) O-methyltransferase
MATFEAGSFGRAPCAKQEGRNPQPSRGGLGRNRTGIDGFAVRYITTLPPGRREEGGAILTAHPAGQAKPATAQPLTLLGRVAYIHPTFGADLMTDFALARRNMIDGQLRPNRVTNTQLLAVIADVPRERFLPAGLRSVAYADDDVPLGNGRCLMEPMVLARLIQVLQPQPGDKALVVASGPGYGAALLARLVKNVVALEADPSMAGSAEQTMRDLGISNVRQVTGPMEAGCPEEAPYDVILIEGGVQHVPAAIVGQLAEGGRLGTVIAAMSAGVLGVAQVMVKEGGVASSRPIFDAGTPALPGFVFPAKFTF